MDEKVDNIKLGESVLKIVTDYESKRATFRPHGAEQIYRVYATVRENERSQLQKCNDSLAAYLERLSHLQLQATELTDLKETWKMDLVNIQERYEKDITASKTALQTSTRETETLQTEFEHLNAQMEDCKLR